MGCIEDRHMAHRFGFCAHGEAGGRIIHTDLPQDGPGSGEGGKGRKMEGEHDRAGVGR